MAFNHQATTVLPMTCAGKAGFRALVAKRVAALQATGGTSIAAGLSAALDTLGAVANPCSSKAVALLTDGQDRGAVAPFAWGAAAPQSVLGAQPPPQQQQRRQQQLSRAAPAPPARQHRARALASSQAAPAPLPAPPAPAPPAPAPYAAFAPLLKRAGDLTAALHTFGFGADHDATLMRHLAEAGRGIFSYISSVEDVAPAFASCLATLKSALTHDLTVELALPPGAPAGGAALLHEAHTAYPTSAPPGALLRVSFGTIAAGERRSVRVTLALPAAPPQPAQPVLAARARYTALAGGGAVAVPGALAAVARAGGRGAPARLAAAALNLEVDAARARDEATGALASALAAAEAGQHAAAAATLAAALSALAACPAREHALVQGLRADLAAMAGTVKDRASYAAGGGGAHMGQAISGHRRQQFAGGAARMASAQLCYRVRQQAVAVRSAQAARGGGSGGGGGGGGASSAGGKRRR